MLVLDFGWCKLIISLKNDLGKEHIVTKNNAY